MELVTGGRVVLGERRPGDPVLPLDLQEALREWAALAGSVLGSGAPRELELVQRRGRQLASRVADELGRPVEFTDPVTGEVESIDGGSTGPIPRYPRGSGGPTPWATGLAVAAFSAVLVAFGNIVLTRAFAEAFGLLWVPANLLVGLGLAPSLHLLRTVPLWRWPAMGATAGLAVAWLVLLLGLLG